jgi:diguanylate cyclase (GGDEF)-like protein/PAS domain S-box-containing protein
MPKIFHHHKKNNVPPPTIENVTKAESPVSLLKAGVLQNAIFNNVYFSNIATDAKGVIKIFNVGAEHMLGYSAADVINKITPADISDSEEIITHAKALSIEFSTPIPPGFEALVFKASRGIEDVYELTYIRKNGSRFPAIISVTALRDNQNMIIGYLLIGTDNTAQKRIEAKQKKLDQRLRDQQFYTRSLIESNIDALIATDPSGIITDVNKQMELLTGCTRHELIGTPFKNYFTDPDKAEEGIKRALIEKKVRDYDLTALSMDGRETQVSYNASTFYDRHRVLQGIFAAAHDITERKKAEQQVINLAFHDSLTKLPNRLLLNERLGQAMATSKRSGRYGALIFLDLDNFKSLNDTHGHCAGDLLLIEVAHRISNCVREVDNVARFGGDEFVVILSSLGTDKGESTTQANIVAEKIRSALNIPYELNVKNDDQLEKVVEHNCTSSIGIAIFLDHEVSTEEVIKWADTAMYKAKEAGGNSIHFFEE